ncbi:outer membrane beta-barrel protein [Sinomicrobium soli]|uniref:outer membrane beta-barrel protein n=1 Tax=Sinomicrobium sp. N-1-3-6 TaxID=2219864 RepID=UPI000DCB5C5C|nr:outer membrane beta-barrel protein [Sinomicrobium sp. N-1-3-6]RAV30218.1 tRNA modification GTPase [Sinomicrobium sp. N-1-3-6]
MKEQLLFLLFAILSFSCYSQIRFEEGYFIDNTGKKNECYIKNMDWRNTPSGFMYRRSQNGEVVHAGMEQVKEFGIGSTYKYVRSTVKIDRSADKLDALSESREPVFGEEQLFLKVLVEGKASLYRYADGNMIRYYYRMDGGEMVPLVYKKYRAPGGNIGTNYEFRRQLWNGLKCNTIKMERINTLRYKKPELIPLFTRYNTCMDAGFVNYDKHRKGVDFNLSVRPRIFSGSLRMDNGALSNGKMDFGSRTGFALGLEAEFVLPFNKNKWALVLEPTYQEYKADKTQETSNVSGGILRAEMEYTSLEIPLGIRHYFFLNDQSRLFVNAFYITDIKMDGSLEFKRADDSVYNTLEVEGRQNLALGLGYKFRDRYSVEIRFQTAREVLGDYLSWNSDYQKIEFILGYTLF